MLFDPRAGRPGGGQPAHGGAPRQPQGHCHHHRSLAPAAGRGDATQPRPEPQPLRIVRALRRQIRYPAHRLAGAWQTVERVQQYRERRVITDPGRPLGHEPAGRDLLWRRTTDHPVSRSTGSSNDSAPSGWTSRRGAYDPSGMALGPGQDGTIVPRQVVLPGGEEENKGLFAPDDRSGCRWLLHIPFGISAVRESRVQPPADRSRQAG
jgi:hypothetical protein